MDCLSENTVQQFLDGTLGEARIRGAHTHLDSCRSCRELLSTLAAGLSAPAAGSPEGDGPDGLGSRAASGSAISHAMAPGTRIGRFIVQSVLGVGGMGVVHAADDPVLGRKVALKLIHADQGDGPESEQWRARLLREARAIARLSHPNVIAVHEIGLHCDRPFVAMELVEGSTLRSWLATSRRTWREIVSVFVAAGRGLLAAHRAGLVHRDFKPDNVLIGHDGRIRVTDFGLACPHPGIDRSDPDGPAPVEPGDSFAALGSGVEDGQARLTRTGTLIGTPGYMAPEVLTGGAADFASDQFSFCVALQEALFRNRPLLAPPPKRGAEVSGPDTAVERKPAARARSVRHPVPGWLRQIIQRGLSVRPADRFPSMESLLVALSRKPVRRRRIQLGAAAVLVLAVGAGLSVVAAGTPDPEICSGAFEQVSGVWSPGVAARVQSSFAVTARPHAKSSAARVAEGVTHYTNQWATMHREACLATARGEQSPDLLDRRMMCLDRRLAQVGSLVNLFIHRADGTLVDSALDMVARLEPVSVCAASAALFSRVPSPADRGRSTRMTALEREVDRAELLRQAGHAREASDAARRILDAERSLDHAPLAAAADRVRGRALDDLGRPAEAREALLRAVRAAERAGDARLASEIMLDLLTVVAVREQLAGEGRLLSQLVEAALEGPILRDDAALRCRLLTGLGSMADVAGEYERAIGLLGEALTICRRSSPVLDEVARVETALGGVLGKRNRLDESRMHLLEALSIRRRLFGDNHPATADIQVNLGNTYYRDGHLEEARGYYLGALSVFEQMPAYSGYYLVLGNLGSLENSAGNNDTALGYQEAALAAAKRQFGEDHPEVARTLYNIGNVLSSAGDFARALELHRAALALREKNPGRTHPQYALSVAAIGEDLRNLKRPVESLGYLERALAIMVPRMGDHPMVAFVLACQGMALLDLGRRREAIPVLERALTLMATPDVNRARAAFALARALDPRRPRSARAKTLAREALAAFTAAGATTERDKVSAYLARIGR